MTVLAPPPWPDATTPEGETFFDNAGTCFRAWKAKGVSNPFALAMCAMAEAESSFNPNAIGDSDTAFGLYQEHPPRCSAIKAGTGIDLIALAKAKQCTIQECVDAAYWELQNFRWAGKAAIESQTTAYGAAMQATALFERASALDAAERRGKMAERWAVHFSH